ncbi:hypothetical protein FGADI_6668 [Fusarium gaditjirri]|uniref:SET domain-containing protein n=1 Tax=Fusarium gaditjirri TaxID=282569 RepID=A0A8H4T7A7_9HYPO|nr:hypothetical protein FGADI_6668 [Fusarium gaditjirri]
MLIDPAFLPWAESKGVKLKGVEPRILPGRGIGIVATRDIKLMPKNITEALQGVSVHGVLAAEIALDESDDFSVWKTVLPTREDLEAGVPMMWPSELQALLPKRAKDILDNQNTTFRRECEIVLKAFPKLTRDEYLYSWVLINTRTFYNSMPKMKSYAHADRLVCMPTADLFNHADQGCRLAYSALGYSVQADKVYRQGEEVYVSYGPHSNDFLLSEYGFILDSNRWDEVYLDEVILPKLNKTQRADLESINFLGRYTLDDQTLGCHRTQVALRMLCCTQRQWQRFFDAQDEGRSSQAAVDELLLAALKDFLGIIRKTLGDIDEWDMPNTNFFQAGASWFVLTPDAQQGASLVRQHIKAQDEDGRLPSRDSNANNYAILTLQHIVLCRLRDNSLESTRPEVFYNETALSDRAVNMILWAARRQPMPTQLNKFPVEIQDTILRMSCISSVSAGVLGCQLRLGLPFTWGNKDIFFELEECKRKRTEFSEPESQISLKQGFTGVSYKPREKVPKFRHGFVSGLGVKAPDVCVKKLEFIPLHTSAIQ